MRLLLDTQTVLVAALNQDGLGPGAVQALNSNCELYFSAASIWEMAMKINLGKMTVPGGLAQFLSDIKTELSMVALPILPEHALILESLPLHHTDSFDRLLVAQSLYENMPIVSIDPKLDPYGIVRIW